MIRPGHPSARRDEPAGGADAPAPEAAPDAVPDDPLDIRRHAELEDLVGPIAMAGFMRRLMEEIGERLSDARLASPDVERLALDAHAIVSSAGMLGYTRLSEACSALERAVRDGLDLMVVNAAVRSERDIAVADGARRAAAAPAFAPEARAS